MKTNQTQTLKNLKEILRLQNALHELVERAMLTIYAFTELCFELGANPLQLLRKSFPEFEWDYRNMISNDEKEEAYPGAEDDKFIREQDLVWDMGDRIVSARRKSTGGKKFTFNMHQDTINDAAWHDEFIHLRVRGDHFSDTVPETMLTVLSAQITEYHVS